MAGDTVANFNFQFTSNADALSKQWDGLIKKANELNKTLDKTAKTQAERVELDRKETEQQHRKKAWRPEEINHETKLNKLRREGNTHLKTRIKGLAALAVAAVSANKIMGGLSSAYTGGVDTARQAKALGTSAQELRNYENLTGRFGGDTKTLHGNLNSILTAQGDIRTKGGDPIIAKAAAIGVAIRNDDGTDRSPIDVHKDIVKAIAAGTSPSVIASIIKLMGLDRSGVLMAGMTPRQMREESADVKGLHQMTAQESKDLLKLARSMSELGQSVEALFAKILSFTASEASEGIDLASDVLQGKTGAAKSYGKKTLSAIMDGFMNYTPQGWLLNAAGQAPDFFGGINQSMKDSVNANRASVQGGGSTTNTTNNNSGGNSTTIHVGTAAEAGEIARSASTIDNTIGN